MATISASNLAPLGHRSACNGLTWEAAAYTRFRKARWSSPPWYTAPEACPSVPAGPLAGRQVLDGGQDLVGARPCSGSRGKAATSPR
jgi:hypothetical protein